MGEEKERKGGEKEKEEEAGAEERSGKSGHGERNKDRREKKKKRCGFSSDVWRVHEQIFLFQCKLSKRGDFPAGPGTMTPHSQCRGPRMDT